MLRCSRVLLSLNPGYVERDARNRLVASVVSLCGLNPGYAPKRRTLTLPVPLGIIAARHETVTSAFPKR